MGGIKHQAGGKFQNPKRKEKLTPRVHGGMDHPHRRGRAGLGRFSSMVSLPVTVGAQSLRVLHGIHTIIGEKIDVVDFKIRRSI